ncbi:MAG: TRAP transporter small permease [Marinovum algicola]|jgi:C4-dicarboxylate transporter DctQ subunit|uniref:TRAP transporter small permease protein n=1 Tax=Marinovum algicola TaxID=42444 RepID=A0A975ZMM9_9RHOB|nr:MULTISPECIES: TRAP transporter small permease [Marinovum]AKO96869.1 TRAP-type C4-dicarboxylate transport system, small permease component [Marinovum algicola DG 898]MDD9740773.1 TRAP transporter small permease [Marinovum sp. SP66]SEJ07053.1 C4-dicarboxylate transporter, DctQ subunit [Marinovum algicola]SLN19579.1 Tripartite ATP-independent periplasmic transporters, DctQ component [Marinovum algicola]
MITWLNRIVDLIENTLVTGLIMTATLVAIAQVIARYVFNNSLYWSEEVILYSLITMSFLTMGMGVRYASHISVEALYAFVSPRATTLLQIGATCLGLIFAGVLIWYGGKLVVNTSRMGQLSPALRIPVGYIYSVIPISGGFMVLRYLLVLQDLVAGRSYAPPQVDIKTS